MLTLNYVNHVNHDLVSLPAWATMVSNLPDAAQFLGGSFVLNVTLRRGTNHFYWQAYGLPCTMRSALNI